MIKFGTGGWRAIIGDEFIKSNIYMLAQAICEDMNVAERKKGIVIGYDRRFLSDAGARWASEVFAANGVKVYYIDKIAPTPLVMYGVKKLETKYGMAVTASHNPASYNGIKVFTYGGRDADKDTTDKFENILASGVTVRSVDFDSGMRDGIIVKADLYNSYIDSIISMINMDAIKSKNLKILLDPMYGVSKTSLQTILMTARCDVDIIHDRRDPLFGGRLPSPSDKTLTSLKTNVIEQGFDIGIATDGDADRIGIIDDKGKFIHPNEILVLLYYYLLEYKGWKGDAVRNLSTTHTLDYIAKDHGFVCHEVPVGFKHISSKMEETDALIGGESSGGMTIRGHIRGKDGIFASVLLVEMMCVTGYRLSEMLDIIHRKYGKMEMTEFDTRFTLDVKEQLQKKLFEDQFVPNFSKLGIRLDKVSYMDGVKYYFDKGWATVRFSGTEPLLRIFSEMENMQKGSDVVSFICGELGLK